MPTLIVFICTQYFWKEPQDTGSILFFALGKGIVVWGHRVGFSLKTFFNHSGLNYVNLLLIFKNE